MNLLDIVWSVPIVVLIYLLIGTALIGLISRFDEYLSLDGTDLMFAICLWPLVLFVFTLFLVWKYILRHVYMFISGDRNV